MRAGPLSKPEVISLLNAHFIPVNYSQEDRQAMGNHTDEERAEVLRVFAEGRKAQLSVGTVHAYVLTAEGQVIDSLHVAQAAKTDVLMGMLRRAVERLEVPAGETIVAPRCQSVPPPHEEGALVLHVTSRNIHRAGWDGFPSESWIPLDPEAAARLLPESAAAGTTWKLDPEVAARFLIHVYPTTENNKVDETNLERHELTGRVLSVDKGIALARIDGSMRMKHNFYYKDDGQAVDAELIGYLAFDPKAGKVRSLRLVTRTARYGNGTFGATIQSQSEK